MEVKCVKTVWYRVNSPLNPNPSQGCVSSKFSSDSGLLCEGVCALPSKAFASVNIGSVVPCPDLICILSFLLQAFVWECS